MNALMHEQTRRHVEAITKARSGSYIFHGTRGVGKAHVAYELARLLNCLGDDPEICGPCRQFAAGTYPDLITVRPEEKPSILIEQIRSLVQALSYSLYHPAGTRVVVVDEAQQMTPDAQNALLKLVEEPPARTVFILVTDHPGALLPTVRSRCEAIYFPIVATGEIASLLTRDHNIKPVEAEALARVSDGAPGIAVMLATKPEEAASRIELDNLASTAVARSSFDRLLLAKRLADSKSDLARFGRVLHERVIAALRSGDSDPQLVSRQLDALERFRRALNAKVIPRAAVERLMLEL